MILASLENLKMVLSALDLRSHTFFPAVICTVYVCMYGRIDVWMY